MTRPAWIAVIMAIAFPSIALVVVVLARPTPPDVPTLPDHPATPLPPAPPGPGGGPGGGPGHPPGPGGGPGHPPGPGGLAGFPGAPPGHQGGLPPRPGELPPPFPEETLIQLRQELSLTDEQVASMREIAQPARERLHQLDLELSVKERELGDMLRDDDVALDQATARLAEISRLRGERDQIVVLTPLRLRRVLTGEQRSLVVELWRRRGPHPPPGR